MILSLTSITKNLHISNFGLIPLDGFLDGFNIGKLLGSEFGFRFAKLLDNPALLGGRKLVHVLLLALCNLSEAIVS